MEQTDDILVDFIIEAREILDQLESDFVQLEGAPENGKLIGNIFRGVHTLKGNSGFFAFKRLEKVSHAGETLLVKLRDGALSLDKQKINALLSALDTLREIIGGIEANKVEPAGDDTALIQNLLAYASGATPMATAPTGTPTAEPGSSGKTKNRKAAAGTLKAPLSAGSNGEIALPEVLESGDTIERADAVDPVVGGQSRSHTANERAEAVKPSHEVVAIAENVALPAGTQHHEVTAPVKVQMEVLDKLINLVSEMVLARNRLLPFVADFGDHNFSAAVRTVDLLTQELQERMMKTRMQPISQVWAKFPRLIRDVSQECKKSVVLTQEGADTELDRALLDAIRDPLVHIIRNCIDHGIELPDERIRLGKPEKGNILLRASHENGMVVIEISDDGGGIKFDLVRQKAILNKLVSAENAQSLSDSALMEFIFLPGFSTKQVVTNLSGRGVGMDVVKTNVSGVGGRIEIDSPKDKGTTIRLKIPLTLAIMPALFVRSGDERYAIPQNSIIETVRIDPASDSTGLEDFYGTPVFRLRGKLVPVILLNQQLELNSVFPDEKKTITIVVLQSSGVRFGLLVDEVMNMQEVVVKALGPFFKGIPDFAGATILGDGRVALILDPDGIATHSGLVAKMQSKGLNAEEITGELSPEETIPMLLFDLPGLERLAIPLSYVDRLESFAVDKIQRNGRREVVTYGDGIMQLLRLSEYVDGADGSLAGSTKPISVITHYINQQPVGLVVNQVHDIINIPKMTFETGPRQRGLMGCVLLDDQVINVIDLMEILKLRSLNDNETPRQSVIDMEVVQ